MAGKVNNATLKRIVKECKEMKHVNLSSGLELMLIDQTLCGMYSVLEKLFKNMNKQQDMLEKLIELRSRKIEFDEQSAEEFAKMVVKRLYEKSDEKAIRPSLRKIEIDEQSEEFANMVVNKFLKKLDENGTRREIIQSIQRSRNNGTRREIIPSIQRSMNNGTRREIIPSIQRSMNNGTRREIIPSIQPFSPTNGAGIVSSFLTAIKGFFN